MLAAGRGERMRPLSDALPKPLLPVAGRTLAERSLLGLTNAGCEAVAVNLHHLGDRVRKYLGEEIEGVPITYSYESELQGTLGALAAFEEFLAPADLAVVINGDSLCRWPLQALIDHHLGNPGAQATMLLSTRAPAAQFGGGVALAQGGRIVAFRGADEEGEGVERRVFAGAHAFAPTLVSGRPKGAADFVTDLYQPIIDQGHLIQGLETDLPWHDMGTPSRYLDGVLAWKSAGWTADAARVEEGAKLSNAVVEADAFIEAGSSIESSVVMTGCVVPADARVRSSILGPGVELPAASFVDGQLVTKQPKSSDLLAGVPPVALRDSESIAAGLIFTPLQGAG